MVENKSVMFISDSCFIYPGISSYIPTHSILKRSSVLSHDLVSINLFPDTAYVRVFVSDVNDNKPVFSQTSYEVDVDEDADVGFAVLTVSANDGDEGRWL